MSDKQVSRSRVESSSSSGGSNGDNLNTDNISTRENTPSGNGSDSFDSVEELVVEEVDDNENVEKENGDENVIVISESESADSKLHFVLILWSLRCVVGDVVCTYKPIVE